MVSRLISGWLLWVAPELSGLCLLIESADEYYIRIYEYYAASFGCYSGESFRAVDPILTLFS